MFHVSPFLLAKSFLVFHPLFSPVILPLRRLPAGDPIVAPRQQVAQHVCVCVAMARPSRTVAYGRKKNTRAKIKERDFPRFKFSSLPFLPGWDQIFVYRADCA